MKTLGGTRKFGTVTGDGVTRTLGTRPAGGEHEQEGAQCSPAVHVAFASGEPLLGAMMNKAGL